MDKKKKKSLLMAAWVGVLILLAGGLYFLQRQPDVVAPPPPPPPPPPAEVLKKDWPLILQHAAAPPYGPTNARYSMVEFGDFQCPQCGKMEPEIFGFVNKNLNDVNMYFVQRPFPPKMHKWANSAAEAAQIAATYGKFWPMYSVLYAHQSDLEPGYMTQYANQIGISTPNFNKYWTPHSCQAQVQASVAFCNSINVVSTPTLCIRDNKTGVISTAVGKPEIQKLLPSFKWAKPGSDVQAPQSDAPAE